MKNYFLLLFSALLLTSVFVSTGCGEDETPTTDTNPTVTVTVNSATTIAPGDDISITVTGVKGTNELNSLTISEDGVNVDAARITIANVAVANNPQAITDADRNGLVYEITIVGGDVPGDYEYEVHLADEKGLEDHDAFTITVEDPTTPIDGDLSGVLFNQGGPAGTGGLDLDAGVGTGSADADAEIRDWGIDLGQPAASNWIQKIGAANGHSMRSVDQSTETYDFDGVTTVEAIADTWAVADDLVGNESAVVAEGDVFVVENSSTGRVYLIRIDEVNVTTGNNDDNYVVSIKY